LSETWLEHAAKGCYERAPAAVGHPSASRNVGAELESESGAGAPGERRHVTTATVTVNDLAPHPDFSLERASSTLAMVRG